VNLSRHVQDQVSRINLRPTEGQKKAGNYAKGHIKVCGLDISIENPKGSWRSGTALDGKTWRAKLPYHYGYIKRTLGADGDHVDVFVGPHLKSPHVFAIDQHRLHDRGFDEHKIMLGFASKAQARKAYIAAFSDGNGAKRIGHIEHMTIDAFKNWLRSGDTKKPIKRADGGRIMLAPEDPYSTPLSLHDEAAYQAWKIQNAPRDSGADYDLRGAYLAGMQRDPDNGHMGDRFKKPNHPTFSDQSQYAVGDQRDRAGFWTGPEGPDQTFVPPVATRARGGRTGYATAAPRRSIPSKPFEPVEAPAFDPTKPFTPADAPPDSGKIDAALRGVRAGATFNLGDEIEGARANAPTWMPELVGPLPARTMVGAAKTGYGYLTGDKDLTDPYEKARDEARKGDEAAKTNHPYIYAGSELAGAVPAMAALPELGAARGLAPAARSIAKFGARTLDAAVTGGEYGTLSGAGEGKDFADRAINAATGLVSGIIGGAGGNAVGEAAGALGTRYLSPAVNTVRGWFNHEGEAARRVAGGLKGDQEAVAQGTADGLTWPQWLAARRRGEPVTLADLGAGRTQALLRSAKNTDPEAGAMIDKTFNDRFHGQSERVADTVRNAIPGGEVDATKTADQIVADYDAGRVPAYKQAYQQGDRPLMSPAMERLMGTDTFVAAMKKAISSGKDRDAVQGFGGFNPMVNVTRTAASSSTRTRSGIPTYPNLQYWDQVKRELDAVANMGKRSGDNERADLAGRCRKILRTELDRQVPSYSNARGIAEQYFGESNALEAGPRARRQEDRPGSGFRQSIMRKMKPDERALFQEGYASDLANRVIGEHEGHHQHHQGQRPDAVAERAQDGGGDLRPRRLAQIQARMYLETIMDGARQALGNSTTAQAADRGRSCWRCRQRLCQRLGSDHDGSGHGRRRRLAPRRQQADVRGSQGRPQAHDRQGRRAHRAPGRRAAHLRRSAAAARRLPDGRQEPSDHAGAAGIARRVGITGQTTARQPATEVVRALQGPMGARADDGRIYVSPNQDQNDQQKQQRP
jgi:hypothetical protein